MAAAPVAGAAVTRPPVLLPMASLGQPGGQQPMVAPPVATSAPWGASSPVRAKVHMVPASAAPAVGFATPFPQPPPQQQQQQAATPTAATGMMTPSAATSPKRSLAVASPFTSRPGISSSPSSPLLLHGSGSAKVTPPAVATPLVAAPPQAATPATPQVVHPSSAATSVRAASPRALPPASPRALPPAAATPAKVMPPKIVAPVAASAAQVMAQAAPKVVPPSVGAPMAVAAQVATPATPQALVDTTAAAATAATTGACAKQQAAPPPPTTTTTEVGTPQVAKSAVPGLRLSRPEGPEVYPAPQDTPQLVTPRMGEKMFSTRFTPVHKKVDSKEDEDQAVQDDGPGSALLAPGGRSPVAAAAAPPAPVGTDGGASTAASCGAESAVGADGQEGDKSVRAASLRDRFFVRSRSVGSDCSGDETSSCGSCDSDEDGFEALEAAPSSLGGGVGSMPLPSSSSADSTEVTSAAAMTVPPSRDCITMERRRFLRAAEKERRWLRRALSQEVREVALNQRRDNYYSEVEEWHAERRQKDKERVREASLRRRQLDGEKWAEEIDREKQERRAHRKAYIRQQKELREQHAAEEQRQKVMFAQKCREAEKRRRAEQEAGVRKEAERLEHEEREREVQAIDTARLETLEQHRRAFLQAQQEARQARDARKQRASEIVSETEKERLARLDEKQKRERQRVERMATERLQKQEQAAELSVSRTSRRSTAQSEAGRLVEAKKQLASVQAAEKGIRVDELSSERRRLHELRRGAQLEARRAVEMVKNEVAKQAVLSKYSPERIQQQIDNVLETSILPPEVQLEALLCEQACSPRGSTTRPRRTSVGMSGVAADWSPSRRRRPASPAPATAR